MADKKITPEQALELVTYLGLNEVESVDAAKEAFGKTYFKPDHFLGTEAGKAFTGKWINERRNEIRKVLKEFGIDVPKGDRELDLHELVKTGVETLTTAHNEALRKSKTDFDATTDEKYKALEGKYNSASENLKQTSQLIEKMKSEHASAINDFKNREIAAKLSNKKESVWGSLKFRQRDPAKESQEQYDLMLNGFKAKIDGDFDFGFDDKEAFVIKKKADGSYIPNPKSHGTWLTPNEVIEAEAAKVGILQTSANAGKVVGGGAWDFAKPKVDTPPPTAGKATIHPGAARAAAGMS